MSDSPTILLVDDHAAERDAMARVLRLEKMNVVTAANCSGALDQLQGGVSLVISDLRLGGQSGLDLLQQCKASSPQTPFVVVTGHANVDTAVTAMKLGAQEYLCKPVNPQELLIVVRRCLEGSDKDAMIELLQQRLDEQFGFEKIIGRSKAMLDVFDKARRAAAVDSTVLITGESGTGKELIAQAIHQNSPRKKGPFVVVNMAAVPEHLVESELFGHMKGAFTNATATRIGRFEAASKGTLFIDEIGDFPLPLQAKLLRVLENHVVTPVGSIHDKKVDVRVVAATSRDLEQMCGEGTFRLDLYYRLNVVTLRLPPLRARRKDIPLLATHFLSAFAQVHGRPELHFDQELMQFFEQYDWPGNVRQLRNCIESMTVLARQNRLTTEDLPNTVTMQRQQSFRPVNIPAGLTLEELERVALADSLKQHRGNRTHAARALGISVRSLQRRLKSWGMT